MVGIDKENHFQGEKSISQVVLWMEMSGLVYWPEQWYIGRAISLNLLTQMFFKTYLAMCITYSSKTTR